MKRTCNNSALNATSTGTVILADKSDIKHGYRKTTKYKTYNEDHVADIIRPNGSDSGRHELFEAKVPSSLTKTAMSNGHYFAFGNTEDRMCSRSPSARKAAAAEKTDGAFNPLTGRGYVKDNPETTRTPSRRATASGCSSSSRWAASPAAPVHHLTAADLGLPEADFSASIFVCGSPRPQKIPWNGSSKWLVLWRNSGQFFLYLANIL